jgi:hypothetical protein
LRRFVEQVAMGDRALPLSVQVTQKEITTHKEMGVPLNAYMLHNLAHVELNAIDLAWDTVVRFAPLSDTLGDGFFADFARVADDESRHFRWYSQRLGELGFRLVAQKMQHQLPSFFMCRVAQKMQHHMSKGPFGSAYFPALALAHAKVVSNTSFSNGFTSEVLFQNELEGMSQKKWLTRLQLTSFLHNSPPTRPN